MIGAWIGGESGWVFGCLIGWVICGAIGMEIGAWIGRVSANKN